MALKVFGAAQPIYTLGESHCMALGNTLFEWQPGEIFTCRSRFLPYLKAQHYLENGALHPSLVEALAAERLIDDKQQPRYLDENVSFAYYSGVPVMSPPMLFFTGDMDMHMNLFKEWGDAYDFILPGDEIYGYDKHKKPVALSSVCKKIDQLLSPFTQALLRLRDKGFSRLMIHCLPARSNHPVKARWLGFDFALRAKLTIIANSYYAEFCQREHIGYIDTWGETVHNGYLRPELDLDGGHLVKSASLITLRKVMEYLYGNTARSFNAGRYALALERSANIWAIRDNRGAGKWDFIGLVEGELNAATVTKLAEGLTYAEPELLLERLDWTDPVDGTRSGIAVAVPSLAQLELAAQLLGGGVGNDILHTDAHGELTVSSFRPVRVHAPTVYSNPPAPMGARRAILHLKGQGTLVFSALNGETIAQIEPKTGTFIVYDPNRISCCYIPGVDFEVVEIAAMPRIPRQPFRVIWSGLKDFPVDPFSYSLRKTLVYPPVEGDRVLERAKLPEYEKDG